MSEEDISTSTERQAGTRRMMETIRKVSEKNKKPISVETAGKIFEQQVALREFLASVLMVLGEIPLNDQQAKAMTEAYEALGQFQEKFSQGFSLLIDDSFGPDNE